MEIPDEVDRRSEGPGSNDFVWPPPLSNEGDIWWDPSVCSPPTLELAEPTLEPATPARTPTGAKVTTRVEASNGAYVSMADLLSRSATFEWQHAVALVQQLGDELKDSPPSLHLLDLNAIDLEATGRLRTRVAPGTFPIVQSLGHVLHQLLADHPGPANLRLIAMQANSETPAFSSVDGLMQALARYERSDRLSELATLYERASDPATHARDIPPPIPIPITAPSAEIYGETTGLIVAFPAAVLHGAVKWWRQASQRAQLLSVVGAMACIALTTIPLVIHESGQSTPVLQAGDVELPASASNTPEANVADVTVTEQEATSTSAVPVNHSDGAANVVDQAQGPKPQRAVSSAARVQPPTSTRIAPRRAITILSPGELSLSSSTLRSTANEMAAASQAARLVPNQPVSVFHNQGVIEQEPVKPSLSGRAPADVPPDPHVYKAGDEGVIEPSPLKQYIPPQPAAGVRPSDLSVLELLIDSRGTVESVHLQNPKNRFRDEWWLSAAKAWQFQPASKDGRPVKFLERVLITTFTPADPQ
jgi:hypothetical protein